MIGGLLRRNKAKNSGLVPLHSRNLVLGMPGTDESPSERPTWSDDEIDHEMQDAFRPHDDIVQELTVNRAVAFVARALQSRKQNPSRPWNRLSR